MSGNKNPLNGIRRVLVAIENERWRQIVVEGFAPLNDDRHAHGQLSAAASCYAKLASLVEAHDECKRNGDDVPHVTRGCPPFWPWTPQWWKPKTPRQNLIRAAALIVAEIERIDRRDGRTEAAEQWTPDQAREWASKEPADRTMVNDLSTGGVVAAGGLVSTPAPESSPPCDTSSSTDGGSCGGGE